MQNLTADQLGQLAADYQKIGSELLKYKLRNSDNLSIVEFQVLSGQINLIIHNSNILAALATFESEEDISNSLNSLKASTEEIEEALKKIQRVQDVIDIAATVINIATSVLSKDIKGTVNNIGDLAKKVVKVAAPEA